MQALDAGWELVEQYLGADGEVVVESVPAWRLGPNVIERVATTETPPDVLVVARQRSVALAERATFVLAADRLNDPGNAGTLIRTAEAAGADGVVLTPGSVDAFSPKVIRSSAGSIFRVPVITAPLEVLRAGGLCVCATSSHLGEVYTEVDWRLPCAVLLGNEARGLDDDVAVDRWVRIPQAGEVESLNVAMAATVLAFEVARQRRAG